MEITLTVKDALYARVREMAENSNRPIEEVMEEKLWQAVFQESESNVEGRDPMDAEMAAYAAMHPKIVQSHLNQFVAITGGKLVDFDHDVDALEERLEQNYPDAIIHVTRVRPHIQTEIVVRSPRFIQDAE